MTKIQNRLFGTLEIGDWNLFEVWDLDIGILRRIPKLWADY